MKKDINQTAFSILQQATGEVAVTPKTLRQINGAKGGKVGGVKRMALLTDIEKAELSKKAREAKMLKQALITKELTPASISSAN